jgi:hypothetical protein
MLETLLIAGGFLENWPIILSLLVMDFIYLGTGLSTIATGVTILGSKESANTIQFISTACFAAHVTLIGFARCSAREEDQRESQLKSLADAVGFTVIPLEPKISDDEDLEKNSSQNK